MTNKTNKTKISVTIDEKTLKIIEETIKKGIFRNKSHAVEFSLNKTLKNNAQQDFVLEK